MMKAFDIVRWDFLDCVLRKFGFGGRFVDLILNHLRSSWFSFIVNDVLLLRPLLISLLCPPLITLLHPHLLRPSLISPLFPLLRPLSSIPSSLQQPPHPMVTSSKNNIFKPKRLYTASIEHLAPESIELASVTQALKHLEW